jgi:hypothetical protein
MSSRSDRLLPNLSDAESPDSEHLLTEYKTSAMKSDDYKWTDRVYHHTDMDETRPIRQPPRMFPLAKLVEVGEMLEDMQ